MRLVSDGGVTTLRILLQYVAREVEALRPSEMPATLGPAATDAAPLESLRHQAALRDGFAELWRLAVGLCLRILALDAARAQHAPSWGVTGGGLLRLPPRSAGRRIQLDRITHGARRGVSLISTRSKNIDAVKGESAVESARGPVPGAR